MSDSLCNDYHVGLHRHIKRQHYVYFTVAQEVRILLVYGTHSQNFFTNCPDVEMKKLPVVRTSDSPFLYRVQTSDFSFLYRVQTSDSPFLYRV
ncbi:hypothetical protein RRG08_021594 [Elysia crispata]|uniref:Uncharacterized protein n=1 Tax=Elysia crispata TaxID=231223 RepID=A0AAE1CES5_9GAST|nr:hypothetical protein RRG08_021594 [Elysia crispata]